MPPIADELRLEIERLKGHIEALEADGRRLDWLSRNPVITKWHYERGFTLEGWFPFPACGHPTFREAVDYAIKTQEGVIDRRLSR